MKRAIGVTCAVLVFGAFLPGVGAAQEPEAASTMAQVSNERLVAGAVLALPEGLREGAEVRAHDGGAVIREGTNGMICLADEPGDDRFHVACYHEALEPFMAAGRRLAARGLSGMARQQARWQMVEAGEIEVPDQPAMVYNLTVRGGDATTLDPASVTPAAHPRLHALYIPYATPESTGLPTRGEAGEPWLMFPGKPSAHVMVVIPPKTGSGGSGSP